MSCFLLESHIMELLESTLDVFAVAPKLRTQTDLQLMVNATKDIKFFQQLNQQNSGSLHEQCCRLITLQHFPAKSVIVNIGGPGDAFYIVLKGRLSVLLFKKRKNDEEEETYREVGELHPGDSFGELALLTNAPRSATIKAKEASALGVLTSDDFQKILGGLEDKKLSRKINFLKELPVFTGWTRGSIARASYSFNLKHTKRGQVMFREGEKPLHVYIIIEGEFKLIKSVVKTSSPINFQGLYGPRYRSVDSLRKKAKTSPHKVHKTIEVAIKAHKELLGDIEVIEHKDYEATCTCTSLIGMVYEVEKTNFLRLMHQQQSMLYLRHKVEEHEIRRKQRMDNLMVLLDKEIKVTERSLSKLSAIKERPKALLITKPDLSIQQSQHTPDLTLLLKPQIDDSMLRNPIEEINKRYEQLTGLSPKRSEQRSLSPTGKATPTRSRPLTPVLRRSTRSIKRLKKLNL
mmetsp:Transcript_15697/g.28641  ORF Transcript_15697/g.28641 Transcript_15697/m.28641 type:complete len:461 (-) Transcript_15697:15-1397(-)